MERNEYQEERHSKFIHSSKRRIQRRVLNLEKNIAQVIYNCTQTNCQDKWFESNFAFLSCWKFSKIDFGKPDTFWCDAIYFENCHIKDKRTFIFHGYAWIGLRSNVGSEWKVPVSGNFCITPNGKRLKNYTVIFDNESQQLLLVK